MLLLHKTGESVLKSFYALKEKKKRKKETYADICYNILQYEFPLAGIKSSIKVMIFNFFCAHFYSQFNWGLTEASDISHQKLVWSPDHSRDLVFAFAS